MKKLMMESCSIYPISMPKGDKKLRIAMQIKKFQRLKTERIELVTVLALNNVIHCQLTIKQMTVPVKLKTDQAIMTIQCNKTLLHLF